MTEPTAPSSHNPIELRDDKLYSVREVATIFSVSTFTVRNWINHPDPAKRLAAMKVGKSWRVSKAAMVDFTNRTYGS